MNAERRATAGLLLAMAMVGAAAWWLQLRPPLRTDTTPLGAFPIRLGSWYGQSVPVQDGVSRMLDADFNLQREYRRPGPDQLIWLYVGYYGTRRGGRPEHLPSACYPSAGWTIEARRTVEIDPGRDSRAKEFLVSRPGEQRLVVFWYRTHQRTGIVSGLYLGLDHLRSRVRSGRADAALVRISTPFAPGEEAVARARLAVFSREVDQLLGQHWPREFPSP